MEWVLIAAIAALAAVVVGGNLYFYRRNELMERRISLLRQEQKRSAKNVELLVPRLVNETTKAIPAIITAYANTSAIAEPPTESAVIPLRR